MQHSKKKLDLKLFDIENLFYNPVSNLPTRIALDYHEKNKEFKSVIYVKLQELKKSCGKEIDKIEHRLGDYAGRNASADRGSPEVTGENRKRFYQTNR